MKYDQKSPTNSDHKNSFKTGVANGMRSAQSYIIIMNMISQLMRWYWPRTLVSCQSTIRIRGRSETADPAKLPILPALLLGHRSYYSPIQALQWYHTHLLPRIRTKRPAIVISGHNTDNLPSGDRQLVRQGRNESGSNCRGFWRRGRFSGSRRRKVG